MKAMSRADILRIYRAFLLPVEILIKTLIFFLILIPFRYWNPDGGLFEQISFITIVCFCILTFTTLSPMKIKNSTNQRKNIVLVNLLAAVCFWSFSQSTLLNIDRSRSFYILSWVSHNEIRINNGQLDLTLIKSQEKLNQAGIEQRYYEQIDRGYISNSHKTIKLTKKGTLIFEMSKLLSRIYHLNGWLKNAN